MTLKNTVAAGAVILITSLSLPAAAQVNSADVSINILEALVAKGLLTPEEASDILKNARRKAVESPAQSDVVRVPYVPEAVREEILDEVRREVVLQAREERWGTPGALPGWLDRLSFHGDLRVRSQTDRPDDNNVDIPDVNAINDRSDGFAVGLRQFDPAPIEFSNRDLDRLRVRARLGVDIDLGDRFEAGLRMVTGREDDPVSVQETLAGDFDSLFWSLDRAYIKFNADSMIGYEGLSDLSFWFGKFENPFYSTDLMFDNDLAFDGIAVTASMDLFDNRFGVFATGGAFPLQTLVLTDEDKWLYGGQLGIVLRPSERLSITLAGGFYQFDDVQGIRNEENGRATDPSAPDFVQKGNTLFNIRNDTDQPGNNSLRLGLASEFEVISTRAGLRFDLGSGIDLSVDAEYLVNDAYEDDNPNFFALVDITDDQGSIIGQTLANLSTGDEAWMAEFAIGHADLGKPFNWRASVGYKELESDATLDAFTESNFGRGGTNQEGFVVRGSLGISDGVWLRATWLAARSLESEFTELGIPEQLDFDTFQLDINARF